MTLKTVNRRGLRLAILGPNGSGKTTYALRLQSELGVTAISTGDICRALMKENTPLGRNVLFYMERGRLVPDDIVMAALADRLSRLETGFILDGFPRTVEQMPALQELGGLDAVIILGVPKEVLIRRLASRRICWGCGWVYNILTLKPAVEGVCDRCGGRLVQRPDDAPEIVAQRMKVYEAQTSPLPEAFAETGIPIVELSEKQSVLHADEATKKIADAVRGLFWLDQ